MIFEDVKIIVEPGEYKEYVKIRNKRGCTITIEGIEGEAENTNVMGFEYMDIQALIILNNMRFVWSDKITDEKAVVRFSRCNYASLDNLIFEGKTREGNEGEGIVTVEYDGSVGAIHNSYFHNQKTCIFSKNGSQVRVDSNNQHSTTPSDYFLFRNQL